MTIDAIWGEIQKHVEAFKGEDGEGYKLSSDPFSFESDPREFRAFYVHPPSVAVLGVYLGGVEHGMAQFEVMLSRPRGDDAMRSARRLAVDADKLAGELRRSDYAGDGFVPDGASSWQVSAPDAPATTVQARIAFAVDYDD